MIKEQLDEILEKHKKWLNDEPGGERANLFGADLFRANLFGANLREADLRGANLCGADLFEADLRGADLFEADLRGADLRGADLFEADLRGANLCGADLFEANLFGANLFGADLFRANLFGANLRGADLFGANLCGADLREADLRGANLCGANLCGADLREADLRGVMDIPYYVCPMCCPEEGSFIGFKKANTHKFATPVIVKLEIIADAKRSSATTRKCRCSKAKVLSITDLQGREELQQAYSTHDNHFIYKVGKIVEVSDFDEDRWNECSTGIHFFITRDEAVRY